MTTILIKKKDTAGAPAAGDLTNAAGGAEIAVNTATKRIYTKDSGGTVVETGTNPSILNVDNIQIDVNTISSTDTNGNINLTPNGTGSVVISKLNVTGAITFDGNVTVGNSSSDTLTVNSTITSNLIFTDNTYDIGASGATRPRTGYFGTSLITPLIDATNVEATNIKALDGTAAITIANSTGVVSFTANPILSGGTANGVLYLNGSKVATSGSLLVFDGTRLLVGKNTSDANNWGIQNYSIASAYASGIQLVYGAVGAAAMWVPAASSLAFGADIASGTTELMRINSTGLGVGTTPSYKLQVSGTAAEVAEFTSSATATALRINNTNAAGWGGNLAFYSNGTGAGFVGTVGSLFGNTTQDIAIYATSGNGVRVYTNGSNLRATINSVGNMGLGATPADWLWPDGSTGVLQLQAGAAFSGYNAGAQVSQNWYYNAGEKFIANGYATRYAQASGIHTWWTSTTSNSGGAGAGVTWAERARINAAGQMIIGGTSNDGRLLTVIGNTNDLAGVGITYSGVAAASISVNSSAALTFNLNNSDGKTERARFSSGGAFIVGGTSAVNSAVITAANSSGAMGMSAYSGANNGTINTIASATGSGGGLIIVSGVSFGSGQSFSRLYLAGVKVSGGAASVFTTAISSVGEAGVSFTFADSGGYVTATAAGLPNGSWTVMWINA
jgi:hypothetical protein